MFKWEKHFPPLITKLSFSSGDYDKKITLPALVSPPMYDSNCPSCVGG
jgi:hypothetical protein